MNYLYEHLFCNNMYFASIHVLKTRKRHKSNTINCKVSKTWHETCPKVKTVNSSFPARLHYTDPTAAHFTQPCIFSIRTEYWPWAHNKTRHKVGRESLRYNREACTDPSHAWAGQEPCAGYMCWLRTERKQRRGAETGTLPKGRRVLWSWQDAASSFLSVSQVAMAGRMGADEQDLGLPVAARARDARTLQKAWPTRENVRGQPSSSARNPLAF